MRGSLVTLEMLFMLEAPQDPIWLRTLSTVLPVAGAILVAWIGTPRLLEALRNRRDGLAESERPPLVGVPPQIAVAAAETAATDPILKLFIDDLHTRLSLAHQEIAELHRLRAVDAGTVATLTAELSDKEERLQECEAEVGETKGRNRMLLRRLEELKHELETTQRKLAICMERYVPPS